MCRAKVQGGRHEGHPPPPLQKRGRKGCTTTRRGVMQRLANSYTLIGSDRVLSWNSASWNAQRFTRHSVLGFNFCSEGAFLSLQLDWLCLAEDLMTEKWQQVRHSCRLVLVRVTLFCLTSFCLIALNCSPNYHWSLRGHNARSVSSRQAFQANEKCCLSGCLRATEWCARATRAEWKRQNCAD